ncbi:MAG: MaoC family dehydratase [Pseudomonadota bacterium]
MNTITVDELMRQIGNSRLTSNWIDVDQKRIDQFADVTEDHQFIHVDEEKAKATPFGGTIAHGYLTLSLLSKMGEGTLPALEGIQAGVNYGCNKLRFINPVRSGKRVRGHFSLIDYKSPNPGTHVMTYNIEVEIEGEDKPALVTEWVFMQMTAA